MTLRLIHSGILKIPEQAKKMFGYVYANQEERSYCLIVKYTDESSPFPSVYDVPSNLSKCVLELNNGFAITLLECLREGTMTTFPSQMELRYSVSTIIPGIDMLKQGEDVFQEAYFSVDGILPWGNVYGFELLYEKNKEELIKVNDIKEVSILKNESYEILYKVLVRYPFNYNDEEMVLKQTPCLKVVSKEAKKIRWFIDIVEPINELITIAVQSRIGFTELKVLLKEEMYEEQLYKQELKVDTSHSVIKNKMYSRNFYVKLFSLEDLISEGDILSWQAKYTLYKPIVNLYLSAFTYSEQSPEQLFLNACQGLETYHARFVCDDKKEYLKRVEEVLSKDNSMWSEFFLDKDSKKRITLRERLADLMVDEWKIYSPFPPFDLGLEEYLKQIVDTRNYYTHYNKKDEHKALKNEMLGFATIMLRNLIEYYLLKGLGFNQEFANNVVKKKRESLSTDYDIYKINLGSKI